MAETAEAVKIIPRTVSRSVSSTESSMCRVVKQRQGTDHPGSAKDVGNSSSAVLDRVVDVPVVTLVQQPHPQFVDKEVDDSVMMQKQVPTVQVRR